MTGDPTCSSASTASEHASSSHRSRCWIVSATSSPATDDHPGASSQDCARGGSTLGLDLTDLITADRRTSSPPTLAAFVATIEPTFTPGTAATYRPYWRLAVDHHGDSRVGTLGVTELHAVVEAAGERARRARPGSTGRSSAETCIAALRAVYQRALAAGLVDANPAASLTKPRRAAPRRRALDDREQADLVDAVRATSVDPGLDLLLVRFHLETGARPSGALAFRADDLDARRATVWLTEKDQLREQPVSASFMTHLQNHHHQRAAGESPLFRRRNGRPITGRDYDRLFARARDLLPWTRRTQVSVHVLRHTAIATIARIGGYPVAQTCAGHTPPTVTGRYLHATLAEVAAAVAIMTGERHPLADLPGARCTRR